VKITRLCSSNSLTDDPCIAMRTLRGENWVDERDVKSSQGKGRPHKGYSLITPVEEIINLIEEERRKESAAAMESIQKLKDLASS
jgi:predicted transcriptional regulator